MRMIEYNTLEEQAEELKKRDIERYMSGGLTRKEMIEVLAEIEARLELLVKSQTGLISETDQGKNEKLLADTIERCRQTLFDGFSKRAPLTQLL